MLRRAEVGAADDDGTISPGFVVTYRFVGDDDTSTFLLGAREIDDDNLDVFSPQSPLGSAIIGARVGETVEYVAPTGKKLKVEIVEAAPFAGCTDRLVDDAVAALVQHRGEGLGVHRTTGLQLQVHFHLVEMQCAARSARVRPPTRWRRHQPDRSATSPNHPADRVRRPAGADSDRPRPCRNGSPCLTAAGRCCLLRGRQPPVFRTPWGYRALPRRQPLRPVRPPAWPVRREPTTRVPSTPRTR